MKLAQSFVQIQANLDMPAIKYYSAFVSLISFLNNKHYIFLDIFFIMPMKRELNT